jgi:hypothetical protein
MIASHYSYRRILVLDRSQYGLDPVQLLGQSGSLQV